MAIYKDGIKVAGGLPTRHIVTAYPTGRPVINCAVTFTTYKIPLDGSISVGSKLTFDNANDRIVVGTGVSKVKVSGKINIFTAPQAALSEADSQIKQNGSSTVSLALQSRVSGQAFNDEAHTERLIAVTAGDYFELYMSSNITGNFTILGDIVATYFTVEVVE